MDTSAHQLSNEQLTWIEGIGNTEQQQQLEEAKAKHFDIARNSKLELKALLAATQDAPEKICEINCKRYPDTSLKPSHVLRLKLKTWEDRLHSVTAALGVTSNATVRLQMRIHRSRKW